MNSEEKKALQDRLGKMAVKDRKEVMKRAAEMRHEAQRTSRKPAGDIEEWVFRLLSESTDPTGTVIGVEATLCDVLIEGEVRTLPLAPQLRPVVGDRVEIRRQRVDRVLPRTTKLGKPDPNHGGREQVVAANMDVVVIVLSVVAPPLHPRIVDRFLFAIRMGGAEPMICVNKLDLLDADHRASELAKLAPYSQMGVPVVPVSAHRSDGLEELRDALRGKRCVFVGHSGVGKSSLLNALVGRSESLTNLVSAKTGKGRHTTTRATLHRLGDGIEIIDTAGVRAFGVDDQASVIDGFPEFAAFSCRFADCRHLGEEGCGVREGVRNGAISRERYLTYRRLAIGEPATGAGFVCSHCGATASAEGAGTKHRNHCPKCLWSLHVDHRPGDRAACCGAPMEPVAVWVRNDGEWALIHRCTECGTMSSNRIAADDNEMLLLSIAAKPLARPPFPLDATDGGEPR